MERICGEPLAVIRHYDVDSGSQYVDANSELHSVVFSIRSYNKVAIEVNGEGLMTTLLTHAERHMIEIQCVIAVIHLDHCVKHISNDS